jgi:hypothetical protein
MEPENLNQEEVQVEQKSQLHQVTTLSKYLAMALFVILPFLSGYIGYVYAPEKVVEKEVIREVECIVEKDKLITETVTENNLQLHFVSDDSDTFVFRYLSDNPSFTFSNDIFRFKSDDPKRPFIPLRVNSIQHNKFLVSESEWTAFAFYEGGRGGPSSGAIFTISEFGGTELVAIYAVADFEWLSTDKYRYKQVIKCSDKIPESNMSLYPAVPWSHSSCGEVDYAQVYPSFDSDWIYDSL